MKPLLFTLIVLFIGLAGKGQDKKDTLNIKPANIPNGIYSANWSGWQVEIQTSDTSSVKVETKNGCKCFANWIKVKSENGWLFKEK